MNRFQIFMQEQKPDGKGGVVEKLKVLADIEGYLDMITGTDETLAMHNAAVEQSTHVLITRDVSTELTDDLLVMDVARRLYEISYIDDPVGIHHHRELYLTYVRKVKTDEV